MARTTSKVTDGRSFSERIAQLHTKRQELIRPVQENPRAFVLASIRDLAKQLNTDPATVLRIVRAMGFPSYRDFKHYLHELSVASATSLDGMLTTPPKDPSLASHGRRTLEQDIRNLHALRHTLDMERLIALAKRIYACHRILLLAGDMAISLVELMEYKFTLLGLPVVTAMTPGKSFHVARNAGKKDLVFAVSFRRGLRQTVEGLQQARENGAYCVGITDTFVSPIARYSNECFLTPVEVPFSNSYVAPTCFINVLFSICAYYRRPRTLALLKKVDREQRHGYRWYPD
jgi:DNA-binding MurR/RpiR family transcriptional regulator